MNNLTDDDEINLRIEADPLIGQVLGGQYKILSVVGTGGMGVVYRGEHLGMGRPVAVKTLHLGRTIDSETLKRFHLEAKAACRVQHPHTVNLYDFGVSDEGQPFLVMELLSGASLRKVLKESGPLGLSQVNSIVQQMVAALACAHDAMVVHKDLKPENIMLSTQSEQSDWVHILDFGIAGMADPADLYNADIPLHKKVIGSPPYMSPEQCALSAEVDHRSDIYSLAIVAFEALCGKFPYKARTAMEMIECHVSGTPFLLKEMGANFSTYESVTTVLCKALEKQPEKRHPTIIDFGREFETAVSRDSVRGVTLKTRVTYEVPRSEEFISLQKEAEARTEEQDEHKEKSVKQFLSGLVGKEKEAVSPSDAEAPKYQVFTCPRCGAQNKEELALCLSCGRSLASTKELSRIRVTSKDFNLPKYQEVKHNTHGRISQKSRMSMLRSGRSWSRNQGLLVIGLILLFCVYLWSGGVDGFVKLYQQWFPASNPPGVESPR